MLRGRNIPALMLIRIFAKLLILGSVINIGHCEPDSEPEDATSRIHFIQYQSVKGTPVVNSSSDNTAAPGEFNTRRSEYYVSSEHPFPDLPEDVASNVENQDPSPVPKNYAFSYAIRDRKSGDDFSHMQAHNGEATKGEYRVKLPDGRVQIVTYTADNGGYRADIRYDKGETTPEKRTDNDVAHPQNNFLNDRKTTLFHNSATNVQRSFNRLSDKTDSPLLYFNEIRTFDPPASSRPASYETVENVDEEQFPYSNKLLDDVNYLLKYVTPTVETQTENVFDITPDSKIFENRFFDARSGPSSSQEIQREREPLPKAPYRRLEEIKFTRPSSDVLVNSRSSPGPSRPIHNFTTKMDPSRFGLSRQQQPKYDLDKLSRLLAKLENRELQRSTQRHTDDEQARLSTPRYESRDQSHSQLVTPRYEAKPVSSTSPNYESHERKPSSSRYETGHPHVFSTPKYEQPPKLEVPSQITPPRYQAKEKPYFAPRYETGELFSSPKFEKQSYELPPRHDAQPFELPPSDQRLNQIAVSLYNTQKFEDHNSEPSPFRGQDNLKFGSPRPSLQYPSREFAPSSQDPPKYSPQEYTSASPEGLLKYMAQDLTPLPPNSLKYSLQEFAPFSPDPKYNLQDNEPTSPTPNYNSQEYPRFPQPQKFPTASPMLPARLAPQEGNSITPSTPLFRPTSATSDVRRPVGDHQFGKIEIPQYLHIHRYEDSGEDAKPKELIYYTPLQIPVPNSIAYMQRGSHNATDPQRSSFLPSYITMTEHPRIHTSSLSAQFKESLIVPEYPTNLSAKFSAGPDSSTQSVSSDYDAGYLSALPQPVYKKDEYDSSLRTVEEHTPPSPSPVSKEQSNENDGVGHYGNNVDEGPQFDARIYSGYFDFIPPDEAVGAERQPEDYQESQRNTESPSLVNQNTPLPQYYYDFSTASPSHRYLSSEVGSEETNSIAGDDQIRNSSFRASAYLRPLRKERVYIHHNSVPTALYDERFGGPAATSKPEPNKSSEVSIMKSISSTIPPELLKDFDSQLRSVFRRDNYDVGNEIKETKVPPPTTRPPKINKILVKKLQSTLPTISTVYLKTPFQQKRIVR